uniref:hypothetical protein n=1 Tax=Arcticibacter sp. TaxID=1872630 RepID=UPI00388EF9D2
PESPEQIAKLELSVGPIVQTEEVDLEFDILKGNGGYTVGVSSEEEAKVKIDGNKVKVNLLRNNASITVTDQKEQSVSLLISSSAKSLTPHNYGIFVESGDTYTMKDIAFGAGGYSVHKIGGTSADVEVTADGYIRVTGLQPGNSYYKIVDQRGTSASFDVMVVAAFDLTSNRLEVTAVNDQRASVLLKWGEGGWRIVKSDLSPAVEKASVLEKADIDKKYDVLSIATAKNGAKGVATIWLQDKDGNEAVITVRV